MSVNILYKNIDFFKNHGLPTPSVERNSEIISFGENRGVKEIATLIGSVYQSDVDNCDYFNNLINLRDELLNFFSDDFNSLEIKENGQQIFKRDFCKINGINFENSEYKKVLNFKIEIICYDESLHNEFFGINNPQNRQEITYANGLYTITREISAVGENTQSSGAVSGKNSTSYSSGMENAIDFVKNLQSEDQIQAPQGHENLQFYLINESETIDRIKNYYAVTQQYQADTFETGVDKGVLRYTVEQSDNFASIKTARINGTLKFSKYQDIALLRDRFDQINFYNVLTSKLNTNIYAKMPVSMNVTENLNSKSLTFDIIYDNNDAYDDCGVAHHNNFSISEDAGHVTVAMSGTVYARGPLERRWEFVKAKFYSQEGHIEDARVACQSEVDLHYGNSVININSLPETETINENKLAANISYSYTFTNKYVPEGFISFNIASSIKMPVEKISIDMNLGKPSGADGMFIFTDAGYNPAVITVSANGVYSRESDCDQCDCVDTTQDCYNWCCPSFSARKKAEHKMKKEIDQKFEDMEDLIPSGRVPIVLNKYLETTKSLSHEENEDIISMQYAREYVAVIVTAD